MKMEKPELAYPDPARMPEDAADLRQALLEKEREAFFLSGIRGDGLSEQDTREECLRLGLTFCSRQFALLWIRIVAWEESFYHTETAMPERVKRFNRFILGNVTQELFGQVCGTATAILDFANLVSHFLESVQFFRRIRRNVFYGFL